jgi:hypothetical protein
MAYKNIYIFSGEQGHIITKIQLAQAIPFENRFFRAPESGKHFQFGFTL